MEILNIIYEYEFIQWILILLLIVVLSRGFIGNEDKEITENINSDISPVPVTSRNLPKSLTQLALVFWLPISFGFGMGFDAPGSEKNILLWCAALPMFTYPVWGLIALKTKKYAFAYTPFIITLIAGGLLDVTK